MVVVRGSDRHHPHLLSFYIRTHLTLVISQNCPCLGIQPNLFFQVHCQIYIYLVINELTFSCSTSQTPNCLPRDPLALPTYPSSGYNISYVPPSLHQTTHQNLSSTKYFIKSLNEQSQNSVFT